MLTCKACLAEVGELQAHGPTECIQHLRDQIALLKKQCDDSIVETALLNMGTLLQRSTEEYDSQSEDSDLLIRLHERLNGASVRVLLHHGLVHSVTFNGNKAIVFTDAGRDRWNALGERFK